MGVLDDDNVTDNRSQGPKGRSVGRGDRAIVLIFSVTSRASFLKVEEVAKRRVKGRRSPLVLVGNHAGRGKREIERREGEWLAHVVGGEYVEVNPESEEDVRMLMAMVGVQ